MDRVLKAVALGVWWRKSIERPSGTSSSGDKRLHSRSYPLTDPGKAYGMMMGEVAVES